ncbi:MAG TPA: hypothetical protein VF202_06405 [Trueperaceae bacterium]
MADLHALELLATLGALVTALLSVVRPESRARLVASSALVGVGAAAALVAGPREEMYGVYAVSLLLAAAAWSVSQRVAASPVREVWREGRGRGTEHVTPPESPWRWVARVVMLGLAFVAAAVAFGMWEAPWPATLGAAGWGQATLGAVE